MKKKRRKEGWQFKRMRRPARLADARGWLSTYQGTDSLLDFERRYGVDRLCAIIELRQLGAPFSEEQEAQVRDSVALRGKVRAAERAARRAARKRSAAKRVEKPRTAKQRAAGRAAMLEMFPDDAYIADCSADEWRWDGEEDDVSIDWDGATPDAGPGADLDFVPDRSNGDELSRLEDALFEDARTLDLKVSETKIERREEETVRVELTLQADPAVLARYGWGVIYAIGACSFDDADADRDLAESDEWTADDMLRGLSFERGRLRFHADHVRSRCMRTAIEIAPEGRITVEVVGRGEAALEWLSKLQGKQAAPLVEDDAWRKPIPF